MHGRVQRRVGALPLATVLAILWIAGSAHAHETPCDSPVNTSENETAADGEEAASAEVVARDGVQSATEPGEPATAAAPLQVGDPEMGAAKSVMCGACHGPDGNAPVPQFPKLAGQRSDYIAKQLRDFKAGRRVDPIMSAMAATLSDQDIADVAAHFEASEVRVGNSDAALAAAGERIYRKGRPEIGLLPCIGCHGPSGEGANGAIDGGFPAVGGQNPDYLAKQLQAFRAGKRKNDWKEIMQVVTSHLSDDDIMALIAYLTSLPRSPGWITASGEKRSDAVPPQP